MKRTTIAAARLAQGRIVRRPGPEPGRHASRRCRQAGRRRDPRQERHLHLSPRRPVASRHVRHEARRRRDGRRVQADPHQRARASTSASTCRTWPKQADKYVVIRNVCHTLAAHAPGQTIHAQRQSADRVARVSRTSARSSRRNTPRRRAFRRTCRCRSRETNGGVETAGYLGVAYTSFAVGGDPNADDFDGPRVDHARRSDDEADRARGSNCMQGLDTTFRDARSPADQSSTAWTGSISRPTTFSIRRRPARRSTSTAIPDKQRETLRSHAVRPGLPAGPTTRRGRRALRDDRLRQLGHARQELREPEETRCCRRWDTAWRRWSKTCTTRGLLDDTVVWSTGEFGRTPTVNKDAGRDHWGKAMSMMLAGGGIKNGQVLGATDKQGAEVTDGGVKPEDVAATVVSALGIDPRTEYPANGRPITLIRDGNPIPQLLA